MTENDGNNQQAASETEVPLSQETQRARDLLASTEEKLDLLELHRKRTQAVDSEYYDRSDPQGKETHRMLGWHLKSIFDIDEELRLTKKVLQHILTGEESWNERPENVPNRLEHSKKHYGLDNVLDI